MCFFFSCTPWHKHINRYFKGACNQFGFGMILKSKDQLSISDNRDGSSTSVVSFTIFQKWLIAPYLGVSKSPNLQDCNIINFIHTHKYIYYRLF